MQTPSLPLILSNRLEILLEVMMKTIAASRSSPFERVLIAVPSLAMKNWMTHYFAQKEGIAFGMEIVFFPDAIRKIASRAPKEVPGRVELALAIEKALSEMTGHPLAFFHAEQSERKARAALEIAKEFLKWGEYAGIEVRKWKKNPPEHWQGQLWSKIFHENSPWVPFYEYLEKLEIQVQKPSFPMQVHLFGLSTLSEIQQQFIFRVNEKISVHTWVLSPSRMFWTDFKSQKEQHRLLAHLEKNDISNVQLQDLYTLLEEANPLIGNNCRLGREWMMRMEEAHVVTNEVYGVSGILDDELPDGVSKIEGEKHSLLHALQSDLALMRQHKEPLALEENDLSIEIHGSPSILREVQNLYQTLLKACDEQEITPSDIIVMVPKLEDYAPFIEMVFNGEDSQLPAEILEPVKKHESPFIQAFFQLLEITTGRFELSLVFQLLENPYFKGLQEEPLRELLKVLQNEGVHWGLSEAHREAFLKCSPIEKGERGSFEGGFDGLLQSLALKLTSADFFLEGKSQFCTPLNFTQSEPLGQLINTLKSLKEDLEPFSSPVKHSWKEWSEKVLNLIERYLVSHDEEAEVLFQSLRRLKAPASWKGDGQAFIAYLKKSIEDNGSSAYEKNLQAVRFCSLQPMRAIPAKVIALLGLSTDDYPRQEKRSPHHVLQEPCYIPTTLDLDRYLFLESLLSAREKWVLSYVLTKTKGASTLVQEVIQYIDTNYLLASKIHFIHPELPFDPSYFSKPDAYPTGSLKDYQSALASVKPPHVSIFSMKAPIHAEHLENLPEHLTLKNLKALFTHPIKFFLKNTLNIRLYERENTHPLMEEFEEEDLWESDFFKWALKHPLEKVVEWADVQGKLPQEPFKAPAKLRLRKKLAEAMDALENMGIRKEDVFEVEFSHGCSSWTQNLPHFWQAPPVLIPFKGKTLTLTGRLPYVCQKGILSFQEPKEETFIRLLPEGMLLKEMPVEKQVCFIKKNKKTPLKCPSWETFLEHTARSFHQPIPHLPSWVKPILKEDPTLLQHSIQQSLKSPFMKKEDPYLKWALPHVKAIDCNALIAEWRGSAKALFGPLLEEDENL